jgi:hypothetical protein
MQRNLVSSICLSCRTVFIFEDDVEDHERQTGHHEFYNQEFEFVYNNKVSTELRMLLHQSIIASLHSLGKRPMNAILYHLNKKGVSIDSNNLDLLSFYSSLEEILGPTADTLIEGITQQLRIHYRIDSGWEYKEISSNLQPLEALQQILKTILRTGGGW